MIDAIPNDPTGEAAVDALIQKYPYVPPTTLWDIVAVVRPILTAAVPSEAREEAAHALFAARHGEPYPTTAWRAGAESNREFHRWLMDAVTPILTRGLSAENAEPQEMENAMWLARSGRWVEVKMLADECAKSPGGMTMFDAIAAARAHHKGDYYPADHPNLPASLVPEGIEEAAKAMYDAAIANLDPVCGHKQPEGTREHICMECARRMARAAAPHLVTARIRELEGEVEVTRKAEAQVNIRFGAERNRVHEMERVVAAGVTQTDTARARARALQDDIAKLDKMLDEERLEAYKILTRAEDAEAEVLALKAAHQTLRKEVGKATLEMDAGKPFDAYQRLCALLNYPEDK